MKNTVLCIVYLGLVVALFKGIRVFEKSAREAWFLHVTKQGVSSIAKVPLDNCILGVYRPELPYSFDGMRRLEEALGKRFTIVSFYQAWGEEPMQRFPSYLMDAISDQGAVPMITWEPWVNAFSAGHLRRMPLREQRCLADVADGAYNFHLTEWARAAVAWGKPFFLRFAHEMTNSRYPWSPVNGNRPDDFILAWRRVRAVFDSLGAKNVIWVWCPYEANSLQYYPGHEYVDWVAVDIFNYGHLLSEKGEERWLTFDQLTSPIYTELSPLGKPIMVAETGSSDFGGNRAVWYREMLSQIEGKFLNIKAVIFFDNPADRTGGGVAIDWSLESSEEVISEMKDGFAMGYFAFIQDYSGVLTGKK